MIIRDFFSTDVYDEIIKRNLFQKNRGKEWFTKAELVKRRSPSPYDHRLQINFHERQDYDADEEDREFWGRLMHERPVRLNVVYKTGTRI